MKILNILFNKIGTVKTRMSILPFLLIVLSTQKGKNIDENNIEIYLKNDPLIVGKYIADNVTTFVDS